MSSDAKSKVLNFKELIEKHNVKIPTIQRDYALGRMDSKVGLIRGKFLQDFSDKLEEGGSMHLDFVYGNNKDGVFEPIDGQQRLTTLFLLYWYFGLCDEDKLKKFSYSTRDSSADFCEKLSGFQVENREQKYSDCIKNQSWFFKSWENDPTIGSMLVMIDSIHDKFKDRENREEIGKNLENIKFNLLEMDGFGLTDDLYIKMNSRGKPLTDFENFKAGFVEFVNNEDIEKKFVNNEDIEKKLDCDWTDFFWDYKDKQMKIDDAYLNFFMGLFYSLGGGETKTYFVENYNNLLTNYREVFKDKIGEIEKLFDWIIEFKDKRGVIKKIFEKSINFDEKSINFDEKVINKNSISYENRLYLYFLYLYANSKFSGNLDLFDKVYRVIYNLVNNHAYNKLDDFTNARDAIKLIIENLDDEFYTTFSELDLKGFRGDQIAEESVKAKLISKDNSYSWIEELKRAEGHWYLQGKVEFLLRFSNKGECLESEDKKLKLSELNIDDFDINKFKKYYEKFNEIFVSNEDKNSGGRVDRELKFQRALLTYGSDDYLPEKGSSGICKTFCSFYDGNYEYRSRYGWLKFFDSSRLCLLKELLDDDKSLETIIDDYGKDNNDEDWRYYFIKYSKMFYPFVRDPKKCNIEIRFDNKDWIVLTSSPQGYHKECYSYALYLELLELNKDENNIGYSESKSLRGDEGKKYVYLKDKNIAIDYDYYKLDEVEDGGWNFRIYKIDENNELKDDSETLNVGNSVAKAKEYIEKNYLS